MSERYSRAAMTAREYYDSDDADNFYHHIWGGEDIHLGVYERDDERIDTASRRTIDVMAHSLPALDESHTVLDIGAGYGGSARRLARSHGCRVTALNISARENARNTRMTEEQGLSDHVDVVEGSFEDIPFEDTAFDVVWSQDAILHSGDRPRVVAEASRVLAPGGHFVFTDPMQADDCPTEVLDPIYERLNLDTLGSPGFYREALHELGLELVGYEDLSPMLPLHYGRIREELVAREEELADRISANYIANMKRGLQHWVDGGRRGHLCWGIFVFRKPH
ncbi:MAG: methyltransferase domain-containing protein [Ectothiorhodospiraceae bacterium]|jgi:sarcosine/dimethylglycine N-methyltransferase